MPRYAIWNKQDDILTIGRTPDTINPMTGEIVRKGQSRWTAEEYFEMHPWITLPDAKAVIGGGKINGTIFAEYTAFVEMYVRMGLEIDESMTPQEVLDAIEAFEDRPQEAPPPTDERIAAALEFLCVMEIINSMEDI